MWHPPRSDATLTLGFCSAPTKINVLRFSHPAFFPLRPCLLGGCLFVVVLSLWSDWSVRSPNGNDRPRGNRTHRLLPGVRKNTQGRLAGPFRCFVRFCFEVLSCTSMPRFLLWEFSLAFCVPCICGKSSTQALCVCFSKSLTTASKVLEQHLGSACSSPPSPRYASVLTCLHNNV